MGPTGVFLFDVKHHKGVIKQQNGSWGRIKRSSGGNLYGASIKNPIKQIKRQIAQIKNLFTQNGLEDLWIEGVVVFTHPEAELYLEASGNPKVLKIDEIETLFERKRASLKPETIEKILDILYSRYARGGSEKNSQVPVGENSNTNSERSTLTSRA